MPRLTSLQNTTSLVSGGNDPMWYTTIYHDTLDVTPWAGLAINNKGNIVVGALINSTDYVYTCLDKNGNILNATNFGSDGYFGELHPDTNSNNFYCYTNDAAVGAAGGKLLLLNERANSIVDSISLTGGEFAKGGSTLGRERLWDSCRPISGGILIPWTGTTDSTESQAVYVSNTDGVLAVEQTTGTVDFVNITGRTPLAAAFNGQGDWVSIFQRSSAYQQIYQSAGSGFYQSTRYVVSGVDSWGTGLYIDRTSERVYTDFTISGTTYNVILTSAGTSDVRALQIRRSAGILLPDNRYDYIITHWAQRTDPSAIDPTDVYVGCTVDISGTRSLFISKLLSNSTFSSLSNTIQIRLDDTSFNPELKSMKFDNRGNLYVYLHGQYNGLSCGQLFKINVDYQINNQLNFDYIDATGTSRIWNYTGEVPSTKGNTSITLQTEGTGGANDAGYGSSALSVTTTDYGISNLNSDVNRPTV